MKKISFLSKAALYKVRIVRKDRTLFNQFIQSDQWELIEEAMEKDLLKAAPIRLAHPKDSDREYMRRYILCPANGNALLVVGEMRNKMDFSYVFVTLHSLKYKEPYVVIERYAHIFRNPDTLAEIVARAFTWALRDIGVEVVLEPWDTEGKVVTYLKDFWESYNLELYKNEGKFLVKMGYEDALEQQQKKKEAKEKGKKSDDIMDYIQVPNKEAIIEFLRQAIKGMKNPKEIARPVRLLCEYKVFVEYTPEGEQYRLPYKAFIKLFPEVEKILLKSRYNEWTNPQRSTYENNSRHERLKRDIENILNS